ncbi:hypothetical protein [Psychrobacter sp. Pi2-1]|uniref:hypothetical protein n=1 Tax=Psychrobacter sp. Pi2-1 TaxID=2774131 RepID=UPI0019198378|nr:hypothetical protein [Psychrobacter sp. Pi2-1]
MSHESKYTELLDDELSYELKDSKVYLEGLVEGKVESISLPFASYNDKVLEKSFQSYRFVRVGGFKFNDLQNISGLIYAHPLNSKSDLTRVKKWIDKAVEDSKWIVLVFHSIKENPSKQELYTNSKEFLEEILRYSSELIEKGLLNPLLFRDAKVTKKVEEKNKVESKGSVALPNKVSTLADEEGFMITFHPSKINTNKLLVSFGGLPSSKTPKGFGSDFAINNGFHHIFVAQQANSQYQKLSLEKFQEAILPLCKGMDVYTYGSSLGGYCAIYYAGVINAQAISAAPKNSAHPTLSYNLKRPVKFLHKNMLDIPRSSKPPIIIYDPYQREENNFINNLILPAYPKSKLIKVPYSGHLVLQVLKDNNILKSFINGIINDNTIIDINYDTENCHIWNYEYARVLARNENYQQAVKYAEKSILIRETNEATKLLNIIKSKICLT